MTRRNSQKLGPWLRQPTIGKLVFETRFAAAKVRRLSAFCAARSLRIVALEDLVPLAAFEAPALFFWIALGDFV
jgi:hypothetical protein